jgi:hypothetical protein
MERRRIIELVIVGLWLTIAVVLFIHYQKDTNKVVPIPDKLVAPTVPESEKGKRFDVRKVTVLRGDSFDIIMKDEGNTRILGKLPVMATEDAKGKVLDLLNHSTNPKVVLREKQPDGRWTIDFFFVSNGTEMNLSEWLSSNNLVYK